MGVQLFFGLATCPDNESSKILTAPRQYESFSFLPASYCTLLGGACSTRSQFREGTRTAEVNGASNRFPGVRVDGAPSGPSEASAKKREPNVGSFRASSVCMSRVKKRSLRRAVKRAQSGKVAVYLNQRVVHDPQSPYLPVQSQQHRQQQRLHIFSWNCSGLTDLLFEELKLYLRRHPEIQVICLQETHRAFQSEWVADGWTFIHSAALRPHQGGVLLGFRDGFCERDSLRWQEVHPGRLLHARCFSQDQHMDFLCLYQHALPFESDALSAVMTKRKQLWNKVDGLLRSLPLRSLVVLAGDFNSNLCTSAPCIGHSVLHNKVKPVVADERQWLTGMLVSHQLAALNSWSRRLHTYSHPSGVSQIDWILVRSPIADSIARQCTPQEAPIAGWRFLWPPRSSGIDSLDVEALEA